MFFGYADSKYPIAAKFKSFCFKIRLEGNIRWQTMERTVNTNQMETLDVLQKRRRQMSSLSTCLALQIWCIIPNATVGCFFGCVAGATAAADFFSPLLGHSIFYFFSCSSILFWFWCMFTHENEWEERWKIAMCICSALKQLPSMSYLHKKFHGFNIFHDHF